MLQDKYGFLWVGTTDGLNRYDGYKFKVYKTVPGNSSSLIDNDIWEIAQDSKGNIWVAANEGISVFDRKNEKFTNYSVDSLLLSRSSANLPKVISVFVDSNGDIWAGTIGTGIIKFNKEKNEFRNVELSVESADHSRRHSETLEEVKFLLPIIKTA